MPATNLERITLAGGCFWCLEAVYELVRGVRRVESGYSNGKGPKPTYEAVCGGNTGYAEVVRLDFDPAEVSLRELLEVFFTIHDPTTLNRQGADVGSQYRSAIYWHSEAQRQLEGGPGQAQEQADAGDQIARLRPRIAQPDVLFKTTTYSTTI